MFREVGHNFNFPQTEEKILRFWKEKDIFRRSIEQRKGREAFVFYEGPPTANGLPHPGHVLTRVIKDLLPRYKTMRGYYCRRKAGWDTHGLPVEIEVEKELGIDGKEQIEGYGVEPFIRKCFESVFRYVKEWEQLTERIGFWIDMENPYITCSTEYVESVWWALSEIYKKGLLYKGHKIVPYCPRCGTVLSSHEVGLGYKETDDPSIYVAFPIKGREKEYFLAWTTTPWTLISNVALVVRKDVEYAKVKVGDEFLIIAKELLKDVMGKVPYEVVDTFKGEDLVGLEYEPLYRFVEPKGKCWCVVEGDFVTLDAGTGIVHCAPAFGAEDYEVGQRYSLAMIQLVDSRGRFKPEVKPWAGRFIKDADPEIIKDLKDRGLLFKRATYRHSYPFCWRCDTPLIYYAREGWFIRTSQYKDKMLENNSRIYWLPEHIKDGRFGNFLRDNIDWALSRERYWGTPLPIWECNGCGHREIFSSKKEIIERKKDAFSYFEKRRRDDPTLPENMAVHKPFIDEVVLDCPKCGGRMRRTPEVIDCWFDSGCMPFAQWGWPHRDGKEFEESFPADFISEAIDQTRGWFYSLLAISTLVFEDKKPYPHPYKSCIVLGLVLGKDGKKLSKRLRNYDEPSEIINREGADALRWYFYYGQPPWTSARFDENSIAEAQREFLIRLLNVYSFFVIYANIDRFSPLNRENYIEVGKRPVLDRWIIAELNRLIKYTTERLDEFRIHQAAVGLCEFVDLLSNWYVRRSRNRFWKSDIDEDKISAHWTLYEVLTTLSKLIAPFVPFFAEEIYQNLVAEQFGTDVPESVHLCDWPSADEEYIDYSLLEQMNLVRQIVSLGRSARAANKIKVRQPLPEVELILADPAKKMILEEYIDLIADELNVKNVRFTVEAHQFVDYIIKPNFKQIGPKYGSLTPKIKERLEKFNGKALRDELARNGKITLDIDGNKIELKEDELDISLKAHEGFAAAEGPDVLVVLRTDIDERLKLEGLARELTHQIQQIRKEKNLPYEARIELGIRAKSDIINRLVDEFGDYIKNETLAVRLEKELLSEDDYKTINVEDYTVDVSLKKI